MDRGAFRQFAGDRDEQETSPVVYFDVDPFFHAMPPSFSIFFSETPSSLSSRATAAVDSGTYAASMVQVPGPLSIAYSPTAAGTRMVCPLCMGMAPFFQCNDPCPCNTETTSNLSGKIRDTLWLMQYFSRTKCLHAASTWRTKPGPGSEIGAVRWSPISL